MKQALLNSLARIGAALVVVSMLGIGCLGAFGIYWSFHRHGVGHGVVAVVIPPYALYRGVASFWEDPEWKVKYDIRAEELAIILVNSASNDQDWRLRAVEYTHKIKIWIKSLPVAERERLKEAAVNFRIAIVEYAQHCMLGMLEGRSRIHPEQVPGLQRNIESFKPVRAFENAWLSVVRDVGFLADMLPILQEGDRGRLELPADAAPDTRAKVEEAIQVSLKLFSDRAEQTLDHIFAVE